MIGTIGYKKKGKGTPVMLLHGFGEDSCIWDDQANQLAKSYQVICPDLPGCGLSEYLFQVNQPPTLEALADGLAGIADAEGWDSFTLLGHSMGGYIALAFAEKYADRLNGLGMVHSTSFADSAEKKAIRDKSVAFLKSHDSRPYLETMIPGLYSEAFRTQHPEIIREQIDHSATIRKEVLIAWQQMMKCRPDRSTILKVFPKPFLFVIGTEDKAVLLEDSLAQCYWPVHHHVTILEGVAHMGMLEKPIEVTTAIDEFLKQVNPMS